MLSGCPEKVPGERERIFIERMTSDRKLEASRGLEMKDLRDLPLGWPEKVPGGSGPGLRVRV